MREVHQLSQAVKQAILRQEGLLLPKDPQLPGLRLGGRKGYMNHNSCKCGSEPTYITVSLIYLSKVESLGLILIAVVKSRLRRHLMCSSVDL